MIAFKRKETNYVFLLLVPITLLIVSFFISSFSNKADVDDLISSHNKYLPELKTKYISQVNNTAIKDSAYVYSAKFYESNLERQLVLIKKNPEKRELLNHIQIHVYPKDKNKYINAENYNLKGYLDYTSIRQSLKYHYGKDNYGVRVINLPFINIEKVYIIQPSIWKKTMTEPYPDLNSVSTSKDIVEKSDIYHPIFYKALAKEGISVLSKKESDTQNNIIKINDVRLFWKHIKNHDITAISLLETKQSTWLETLKKAIAEKRDFNRVFNIEKLATYYSLVNLFSNNKSRILGIAYDEKSSRFEPVYINQNNLGELNTYIKDENIADIEFKIFYAQKLKFYSDFNIEILLDNTEGLRKNIIKANNTDPTLLFRKSILEHNKYVLRKGITPSTGLKVEFIDLNNNIFSVSVKNLSDFPIKVNYLNYQSKTNIAEPNKIGFINSREKDTLYFKLPRSFENLFVHKKTRTTGFIFEKNIEDLFVSYNILGLVKNYNAEIIPYQPQENYNYYKDLFRQEIDISNLDYLNIDQENKVINIFRSFTLKEPLIFPKNYLITAESGIEVNIEKGGKVISHSPFEFIGTKAAPIKIISKDKEGQGLLIMSQGKASQLTHVYFDGLTNPSHGMWSTTSAVTFYESPVNFDYVRIENNFCEDAINVVRANFKMTNSSFKNTQSDAFDGDFVTGIINSCVFQNLGNDAIDVSGSDLIISNVKIIKAGDKALSAGEDSKMNIHAVSVRDCEIALAGKDLSIVKIENLNIRDTKLGFTAFQKKSEFGPSSITANNITMINVETDYLIENTSSLNVDGKKIKTELADVKSLMYGVEFGVSSEKTRNSKEIK